MTSITPEYRPLAPNPVQNATQAEKVKEFLNKKEVDMQVAFINKSYQHDKKESDALVNVGIAGITSGFVAAALAATATLTALITLGSMGGISAGAALFAGTAGALAASGIGWAALGFLALCIGLYILGNVLKDYYSSPLTCTLVGQTAIDMDAKKENELMQEILHPQTQNANNADSSKQTLHLFKGDRVWIDENNKVTARTQEQQTYINLLNADKDANGQPNLWGWATLASMYSNGNEEYRVPEDPKKAVKLYQKLADNNVEWGINQLACAYELGRGVDKDLIQAEACYKRVYQLKPSDSRARDTCAIFELQRRISANEEDADAMMELAGKYSICKSAEKVQLYQKAAALNNLEAQVRLGEAYEEGRGGLERNLTQAITYYKKASEQGNLEATTKLNQLISSPNESLITKTELNIGDGKQENECNAEGRLVWKKTIHTNGTIVEEKIDRETGAVLKKKTTFTSGQVEIETSKGREKSKEIRFPSGNVQEKRLDSNNKVIEENFTYQNRVI